MFLYIDLFFKLKETNLLKFLKFFSRQYLNNSIYLFVKIKIEGKKIKHISSLNKSVIIIKKV